MGDAPDLKVHCTRGISKADGVVLLHGISRTALSFRKMQLALERAGFATLNLDYESRRKALEGLAEDIHPAIRSFADRTEGSDSFRLPFHGRAFGPRLHCEAPAQTPRPRRDAGHAEQRQRNRRPAEAFRRLPRLLRPRRAAARHPAGRCDRGVVSRRWTIRPVGSSCGNRSIDPLGGKMLPKPHDGRGARCGNGRIDGMADHMVIDTATSCGWCETASRSRRRSRSCKMGRS